MRSDFALVIATLNLKRHHNTKSMVGEHVRHFSLFGLNRLGLMRNPSPSKQSSRPSRAADLTVERIMTSRSWPWNSSVEPTKTDSDNFSCCNLALEHPESRLFSFKTVQSSVLLYLHVIPDLPNLKAVWADDADREVLLFIVGPQFEDILHDDLYFVLVHQRRGILQSSMRVTHTVEEHWEALSQGADARRRLFYK